MTRNDIRADELRTARLAVAVVRLNRRLRKEGAGSLSLSQLSVLASLHRSGPQAPGELAANDNVRPSSTTRVLCSLQELGMTTRNTHPRDRRRVVVELTDAGRAHIEHEVSAREHWLEQQLTQLSKDERATLSRAADIMGRVADGRSGSADRRGGGLPGTELSH
ncbi:MarR family transcriptional regulator [Saccharopolyspora indica]|uniref:MarR family transcriptional regulator n=1 Tax=Saccharopolyspora indica TaxID=1229659 RepID=UPI0022EB6E04|nr:MarR family transcriptional regulator [Saccharopolyspora indica]MDA3644258.1 MarR family transcriptional regulator [Saccharopolyspora indica]